MSEKGPSWSGIPELLEYHREVGPLRFWSLMGGTFAWIGLGVWLQMVLDYPAAYGSSCQRKCLIESYWFSPVLVSGGHGGLAEFALFAWLWFFPAILAAALAYRLLKQRSKPKILPFDFPE